MARKSRHKCDEMLALALARGATVKAAAAASGHSMRTAHRRLDDDEFRRRVRAIKDQMLNRTVGYLSAAGVEAARELRRLAKQSKQDSVKLRACEAIINLGGKLRELSELAERIDALEKANERAPAKTT
jgi:hypothetical protein